MDSSNRDFKGVWIPKEVWLDDRLSALEKIILTEIDSLDNGEKGCWASNNHLASFCQCSEWKVSSAISKLKKLGYVYLHNFDGRTRQLKTKFSKDSILKTQSLTCENPKSDFRNSQPSNTYNNIKLSKDNLNYYNNTKNKKGFCGVSKDLSLDKDICNKKITKNRKIKNYEKYLESLICDYDETTISNKVIHLLKDFYEWRCSINKNPSKVEINKNLMDLAKYDENTQTKWLEKTMLNSWIHLNPEYIAKDLLINTETNDLDDTSNKSRMVNEWVKKYGCNVATWLSHYELEKERISKYGSLDKFYEYVIPKLDEQLKQNGKIDINNIMS